MSALDPCDFATAERIAALLRLGIDRAFPVRRGRDGQSVTLSDPRVEGARCPGLRVGVRTVVSYRKTRGVPQFSTRGHVRFLVPVRAEIAHRAGLALDDVRAGDLEAARACIVDVRLRETNLRRRPDWLDDTLLRDWLNGRLRTRSCVDVTSLVRGHLSSDRTLSP